MNEVALFLAEGFEEIEAVTVADILRRAGITVKLVSVSDQLMVLGAHNIAVFADFLFSNSDFTNTNMLILPGGMPGTKGLNAHIGLRKLILEFFQQGRALAAICAAPLVYGDLGLLQNKNAICYPGFEHHLVGAIIQDAEVVRDGAIITSKGPGTVVPFSLEIVDYFFGQNKVHELSSSMIIR